MCVEEANTQVENEHSPLNFHLASSGWNGGPKALDTSLRMINSYPLIIRGWILGKGGIENMPYDGFLQLPAKVLWDMGYRRCAQ